MATTFGAVALSSLNVSGSKAEGADFSWDNLLNTGIGAAERIIVEQQRIEQERIRKEERARREELREIERTERAKIGTSGKIMQEKIRQRGTTNRERLKKGQSIPPASESEVSGPFGEIKEREREGTDLKEKVPALNPEAIKEAGKIKGAEDFRAGLREMRIKEGDHEQYIVGYVLGWMGERDKAAREKPKSTMPGPKNLRF